MKQEKRHLPDDPEILKQIIESLEVKYDSLESNYQLLEEKYKTLQRRFLINPVKNLLLKMKFRGGYLMKLRPDHLRKMNV